MEGNYIIKEACKVLPLYFYNFLKTNLKTKFKFLYWKIVNINIVGIVIYSTKPQQAKQSEAKGP